MEGEGVVLATAKEASVVVEAGGVVEVVAGVVVAVAAAVAEVAEVVVVAVAWEGGVARRCVEANGPTAAKGKAMAGGR